MDTTYNNLLNNQHELRKEISAFLLEHPMTMIDLAREIGIAYGTMFRFIRQERPIRAIVAYKIAKYITEYQLTAKKGTSSDKKECLTS